MKLTQFSKLGWLLLVLSLTGCSSVNEKVTGWLSSNVDAIAVLDGKILRGKATFPNEREATLQLQSSDTPSLTCLGAMRYTATNSGVVTQVRQFLHVSS